MAVTFRHDDIQTYSLSPQPVSHFNELCKACSRLRPAAQCGKAGVVDIYNDDRKTFHLARKDSLVSVENKMTQGTPKVCPRDCEGNGEQQEQNNGYRPSLAFG